MLTIGELSRRAGIAPTALRYYEQIGLLPAVSRVGGRRRYDDAVVSRLEVIRVCKAAGFTLDDIVLLFADRSPGRPDSRALARDKLAEIELRMQELVKAKEIVEWGLQCACPSIDACSCGIHPAWVTGVR